MVGVAATPAGQMGPTNYSRRSEIIARPMGFQFDFMFAFDLEGI